MSESTPSNAASHTENPDIASLYLATIVTVDDHGAWRPAREVTARLGTAGRPRYLMVSTVACASLDADLVASCTS